jgi:4-hydroxy-2-oxoheptanedioate aldolase
MIRENRIKKGLKQGKSYIGTFAKIADPCVIEIFSYIGFDFVIVDNEHTQMNKESMVNLVRTAGNSDIVPTIRIKNNDPVEILQALDSGALGVQVPMTETRETVQMVADSAKYAPLGNRGYSASHRAGAYGFMDATKYAQLANENTMVAVYCETKKAMDNLEEIVKVDQVDIIFIGPFDLTQALGVIGQPRHPLVLEAIAEITKKTRAAGKAVGIISSDAPMTKQWLDMGIQYIALSSDQAMIGYAGRQFMKELGRNP